MILKFASKALQRSSVIVTSICLVLFALSCGAKRVGEMRKPPSGAIAGYVHVIDIQGMLGTRALSRPGALSLDPSGNLIICDTGNNRLVKVRPDGTFLAETGGFGFSRDKFNSPTSLGTSDKINFYLFDSSNDRIVRLDYDLNWLSDISLGDMQIEYSIGRGGSIAVNSFGDIYVSDPENSRVIRFDSGFNLLSELTELGGFLDPGAMAFDSRDNLYVVNREEGNLVVFDSYDGYVTELLDGELSEPTGIRIDRFDRIYAVDQKRNSISVFSSDGKAIYSFGSTGQGQYQFMRAHSVCVGDNGWIYVSDQGADKVAVFRPAVPE
jgi:DNA-binding beta-propeller fold protein YncE